MSTPAIPQMPKRVFDARCKGCWFTVGFIGLVIASFWSLDLKLSAFFVGEDAARMVKFLRELMQPDFSAAFVKKLWFATWETLAMSALGTLLAAALGLLLALPAAKTHAQDRARWKPLARGILNVLRSVPELVWASLLLIAAGLGPFPGTLALALHTTGVLGRLFAQAIENAPPEAAFALRARGASETQVFCYATLMQTLPQLMSYTLYRWENNIRAAAVLGVVGAGGLGQMLAFHMGLFHMSKTSSVLIAMLILVAIVDAVSYFARRAMQR